MQFYEITQPLAGPILKAHEWIQEANTKEVALPHAMNVSSVNAKGRPSSRMVLLKRVSQEGFVFFTDFSGFVIFVFLT